MTTLRTSIALVALGLTALVGFTACGGSGGDDTTPAAAAGGTAGGTAAGATVTQKDVNGVGEILVDAKGDALYSPDQEKNGRISCMDECASVWVPLTVPAGQDPTGADDLDVVMRPDGSRQVTYKGAPLYTFAEDASPGDVNGNRVADSFAGKDFTWHVAGGTAAGGTTTGSGTGSYRY